MDPGCSAGLTPKTAVRRQPTLTFTVAHVRGDRVIHRKAATKLDALRILRGSAADAAGWLVRHVSAIVFGLLAMAERVDAHGSYGKRRRQCTSHHPLLWRLPQMVMGASFAAASRRPPCVADGPRWRPC